MSHLVIVESPAKCSKIQGFLGFGWKVIASLGHIRRLKEDLSAVGLTKDFASEWEWIREKAQTLQKLKDAAKDAQQIYLAADDDREGELIAYSVCLLLKLNPETTPRLVFHEITESAIKHAVAHPRRLDMNKIHAAEARSILDMMIGFTMSPLLWKAIGPALSAGRCQTPALRLVAEREKQVKSFTATSSWKVHGQWSSGNDVPFEAALMDDLEDRESALNFLDLCHETPGATVTKAITKPWTESPPPPLITSTLQQQASSLYRITPKDTMKIAQKLYEAGHITYMRTDKAVLSEEAKSEAKERVAELYGANYCRNDDVTQPKKLKGKVADEPKAQEAHEAIRPTHFEHASLPATDGDAWSSKEQKLYQLIWLRAIQSVMASAKGQQRTIQFLADAEDSGDFPWSATWRKTDFQGWRRAATTETDEPAEADADSEKWTTALTYKEGTRILWKTLAADPHETKAPSRYTEASLVKELETKGIGRPSTFATLISTILEKEYVKTQSFEGRDVSVESMYLGKLGQWPPKCTSRTQKLGGEKDRLTPTPLGLSVLDFLLGHFDDLFAYEFTANMEKRLDLISEGNEGWKQVLQDTWDTYKDRYETLNSEKAASKGNSSKRREFGDNLIAVLGKKGPLLMRESPNGDKEKTIFYSWPEGVSFPALTEIQALEFVKQKIQEQQGNVLGMLDSHPVVSKTGKFGPYVEWQGKRMSYKGAETFEEISEKLKASAATPAAALRVAGQYEIRKGPYGLYMFKHAIKGPSRKFVNVPPSINTETVSEQELDAVYKAGLEMKSRSGANTGQRGRGGWRGKRGH
jgi:DNA topoisomerase-1